MRFDLLDYERFLQNVPVISIHQIEYTTWLHIPRCDSAQLVLFDVRKIAPNELIMCTCHGFERDGHRPWFEVVTDIFFDLSPGFHAYRFSFENHTTSEVVSLFFGYTIQTSEVDKPYIYMRRRPKELTNNCRCNCNC